MKLVEHIFLEAMKEPYLYVDHVKQASPRRILEAFLAQGELFVPEIDGKVVGYALFREIIAKLHSKFEIYLLPEHRKTLTLGHFRECLEKAAFAPFPEGLELVKLKASVHPLNISSLKACQNSGFMRLAEVPFEALFDGKLSSMIFLELYPKSIRDLLKPQVINGRREHSISKNANGSDIPAAAVIRPRTVGQPAPANSNTGAIDVSGAANPELSQRPAVDGTRLQLREGSSAKLKHVGKPRRAKSPPA
jgi:hypothetical protein